MTLGGFLSLFPPETTKTTDPMGKEITLTYDADGRPIAMKNRLGNTYTTSYNDALRTITTKTPEGKTTTIWLHP